MCGRFTLKTNPRKLAEEFLLGETPVWEPRFNIAPTQDVAAVRLSAPGGKREFVRLRWGLVPAWATDVSIGNRMINGQAETATEKPAFRSAIKARRCLVLADGFYEWAKVPGGKQPYYFQMRDGRSFAFAGLWERWEKGGEPLETCTLLTTSANKVVGQFHERMPLILEPADYDLWLDTSQKSAQSIQPLLRPLRDDALEAYPVSRLVNSPTNEDPRCVERQSLST
jgi:putative SOS response-associated peptidase YedK